MALHVDPGGFSEADRDERLRGAAARLELRPARRAAHLATRSLACPCCGVPVAIAAPVGFSDILDCAFCETSAPTRDFIQHEGWPQVDVIARLG